MRKFKQLLISVALGLLPFAAMAKDTISPSGSNTWDLYVYGNGPAISAILTAIKLMIAPDNGSSSFQYLLLFLATAGFLAMAVKAGFDPAKNFIKMFFFLITIWMVTYLTRGAGANVNVMDPVTNYSNVVQGVPALVAVPAAIISQVGYYLTLQVEQNFTMPNGANAEGLNISSGAEYNLFAKMIGDGAQYTIQDPDLKRSLAAYMSDCVVAAVARGTMPVSVLLNSPNLLQDLGAATNQAIMTRYYLTEMQSQTATQQQGTFQGPTCGGASLTTPSNTIGSSGFNTTTPGLGVLVSCQQAYTCLTADMPNMASALDTASASQWQSSGITVPFDTAMSSAIALAGADGGANPQSGYASPESFILQKAMVSSATGAFRQAATNTGNNEIMLATSLAQAEQSQKTSWVTATEIFKNMMGYVYTVLQAFIFAMVPIVVICLMIPGMGHVVLLNYIQILVWLTLWTPMLAIVNFLIEIFGSSSLGTSLGTDGLTMGNSALVSEQANNMQIVAEFMGTLVPLMTWGLVKGAMAFTEFISHGIGSSFATQAGAQASTGNVSMGNIGMDNTTMNKYNTQRSIATGDSAVEAGMSAGSGIMKRDDGLEIHSAGGVSSNLSAQRSTAYSFRDASGEQVSVSEGTARAIQRSNTAVAQEAKNIQDSVNSSLTEGEKASSSAERSHSWSTTDSNSVDQSAAALVAATTSYKAAADAKLKFGASAGIKGGMPDLSIGGGLDVAVSAEKARQKVLTAQSNYAQAIKTANDHSEKGGGGVSAGRDIGESSGRGSSGASQFSYSDAHAKVDSLADTVNSANSLTHSIEAGKTESYTISGTEVQNSDADRRQAGSVTPESVAAGQAGFAAAAAASASSIGGGGFRASEDAARAGEAGTVDAGLASQNASARSAGVPHPGEVAAAGAATTAAANDMGAGYDKSDGLATVKMWGFRTQTEKASPFSTDPNQSEIQHNQTNDSAPSLRDALKGMPRP